MTNPEVPRVQFSLLNLFEIILAYSLVFAADRAIGIMVQAPSAFVGPLTLMGVFYTFKILLTIFVRKHRLISTGTYFGLVAIAIAWVSIRYGDSGHSLSSRFLFVSMIAYTVPTCSFFRDLRTAHLPTVRFLIWRSAIETLFIIPAFLFLLLMIFAITLGAG